MSGKEWAEWAQDLVAEMREEIRALRSEAKSGFSSVVKRVEALERAADERLWLVSKIGQRWQLRATLPAVPRKWLVVGGGVAIAVVAKMAGLDLDLRQLLKLLGN